MRPREEQFTQRSSKEQFIMSRFRSIRAAWLGPLLAAMVAAVLIVPAFADAQTLRTSHRSNPDGVRPTIVLVHGGWANASSWDRVIPKLQREGFTVDAPPNPLLGLASDSAFLTSYLSTISGPIILVGHSYGGAVITNAATGNPNVKALVYVDAFQPASGESLEQLTFAKPGSCLTGGGNLSNVANFVTNPSLPPGDPDLYLKIAPGTDYAGFDTCFATLVPPREAAVLSSVQVPFPLDAFTAPSGTPAWLTTPSWAVIGTYDQAIPPAELTFMAQRAHSRITYVRAGHLSMITQPRTVANVITEAARTEG
jgi:pimeloyl-ACP methyl ester carboxylesterase